MATKAAKVWNGGKTGKPTAPAPVAQPGACIADGCGTEAGPGRAPRGLARVEVPGSREPARLYCRGGCAGYGQALAEVRALPLRDGQW